MHLTPGRSHAQRDAQSPRRRTHLVDVRPGAGRRPRAHRCHDVEQRRGVAHRPGEHTRPTGAEVGGALHRPERHEAPRGLDPHQPAVGGGDPHRPCAVGAVGGRAQPRRHRGRGTSARSARRERGVPRVAADAVESRRGHARAELRHVRLAEHDQAGPPEPGHHWSVGGGHVVGEHVARVRGGEAGDIVDVLDRERDARQRRLRLVGVDRLCGAACTLGVDRDVAPQQMVDPFDALQVGLGQLDRRDLSPSHRVGLPDRVERHHIGHVVSSRPR